MNPSDENKPLKNEQIERSIIYFTRSDCPTCNVFVGRIEFKLHKRETVVLLRDAISELVENKLQIVLADTDCTLYFTKTHIADMKTVVEVDMSSETLEDEEA